MTDADHPILNDGFLDIVAEALRIDDSSIQLFDYAGHFVIRDVRRFWNEQELWRRGYLKNTEEQVRCEAERRLDVERLRAGFRRALEMIARPYPGQENSANAARQAFAFEAIPTPEPSDAE